MIQYEVRKRIIAELSHMHGAGHASVRAAVVAELAKYGPESATDSEIEFLVDRICLGPRPAGWRLIGRQIREFFAIAREARLTADLGEDPTWMQIPADVPRVSAQLNGIREEMVNLRPDAVQFNHSTIERIIRDVQDGRDRGETDEARTADCWLQQQSDDSISVHVGTELLCVLPSATASLVRPVIERHGDEQRRIWIDAVLRGSTIESAYYTIWIPALS